MKKLIFLLILFVGTKFNSAYCQDPNQNPNYHVSRNKYMFNKDSLLLSMNTTQQNTYKAFDWSTYKLEKKQQRIIRRQERVLTRRNETMFLRGYNPYLMRWPRPYWGYYNW